MAAKTTNRGACRNSNAAKRVAPKTKHEAAPWLFGDYELIIDLCCGGDPDLKRKVAEADARGRRGLAVLKYHLSKLGVRLPPALVPIMEACEADQEYYDTQIKNDMRNIQKHGAKFRVSVTFECERYRRTFETVEEARRWRDQLRLHFRAIAQEEVSGDGSN